MHDVKTKPPMESKKKGAFPTGVREDLCSVKVSKVSAGVTTQALHSLFPANR